MEQKESCAVIIDLEFLRHASFNDRATVLLDKLAMHFHDRYEVVEKWIVTSSANPREDHLLQSMKVEKGSWRVQLFPFKTKQYRCHKCRHQGVIQVQKSVDVFIGMKLVQWAHDERISNVFVCTGDGDFQPVMEYLADVGRKTVHLVVFKDLVGVHRELQAIAQRRIMTIVQDCPRAVDRLGGKKLEEESLRTLIDYGIEREEAEALLRSTKGDVHRAVCLHHDYTGKHQFAFGNVVLMGFDAHAVGEAIEVANGDIGEMIDHLNG